LAYQTPASSIFLSQQISQQQPASSTFLSEQTSTSHQPNEQAVRLKYMQKDCSKGSDESYMLLHTFEEFPRDSAKEFSNFTCLLLVY
jgi:hypothetical protein